MIVSEIHRGLIYAGDTPLACTIDVAQTGPLALTVRAGSFRTTGEASVRAYDEARHEPLIAAGKAERMADGRVRVWLTDADGQPIAPAATYTLAADQTFTLAPDPLEPSAWRCALALDADGAVTVLPQSRRGAARWPAPPAGWRVIHALVFVVELPTGTTDLAPLPIITLRVLPGFPPGTGPEDWLQQGARVPVRR